MRAPLLTVAPDLACRLTDHEAAEASRSLTVATMAVPPGEWQPPCEPRPNHVGLLMLDGLMLREVRISRDWSTEVLSAGDLLRPWLEDSASFAVARWQVLEDAQLAVLDHAATTRIGRYPGLVDELVERAMRRSRSLAVHAVVEGVHRVDQRLLLLFWHLAEQHGTRVNGEIRIPMRLTHAHLSRLVGARRPTVTTALGALAADGTVRRLDDGGWAIAGEPPEPGSLD